MSDPKPSRLKALLGLAFTDRTLEAVVVRRNGPSLAFTQHRTFPLDLDPLSAAPELAGRAIRQLLDEAGIKERSCIVAIPTQWILSLQTELPPLDPADVASFLQIEAERHLPQSVDSLQLALSQFQSQSGKPFATQLAVPRDHVLRLDQTLRAARLDPLSFTLGLPALLNPNSYPAETLLTLFPLPRSIDLLVTSQSGIVAIRNLEQALDSESPSQAFLADVVAREIRITLGQTPEDFRQHAHRILILGDSPATAKLAAELQPRVAALGLKLEHLPQLPPESLPSKPTPPQGVSPAFAIACRALANAALPLEFLPPRISAWQAATARYASKKFAYAAAAAAILAALCLGAFLFQQWKLNSLRKEWAALSPKVARLSKIQDSIRTYRPWFDDSFRTLSVLKHLTEAFPTDGSVTLKSFVIRDSHSIACSGTATDSPTLTATLDKLRAIPEIGKIQTDQVVGKSPVQFTFNFTWDPSARP